MYACQFALAASPKVTGTAKCQIYSKMISTKCTQRYLWLNQLAYSFVAFPIGTVISVAPLFLDEQLSVSLPQVGWAMTVGEGMGILAMKGKFVVDTVFAASLGSNALI